VKRRAVVEDWSGVPGSIRKAIRGLSERDLDLRGGDEGWSIRETVHHLVEANLIASNMIIAALAVDGYDFDWTWVYPSRKWMQRVGYDKAAVAPAIAMLQALCRHVAALIAGRPPSLKRAVKVNDTPGAARYTLTVEDILRQQADHAQEHLREIRAIREKHQR
jgi:hypothetical protein